MNNLNRFQQRWSFFFVLTLPALLLFSTPSVAAINFQSPAAGATLGNTANVVINVPVSSNASAEKINIKIDDNFYRSQVYVSGRSNYQFSVNTAEFKNGWHKLTVLSIKSGRIVSISNRWVNFNNEALRLNGPAIDDELSGFYTVTGTSRVMADKINIKFDNNNSFVYSLPVARDRTYSHDFSIRIDTKRLSDGSHTMFVRAVTNGGKDLKTLQRQIMVRNNQDGPVFDATRITPLNNGVYSGLYTQDGATNWEGRLAAIASFEDFVYPDGEKMAMDRQFYRWNDLLRDGVLNRYIKETSDDGRIPIISLHTLNHNGSEVVCPDDSNRKVWACITAGKLDAELLAMARAIRDSGVPRMGFSFVLEPENEIRCHNGLQADPNYKCVPEGKGFDMGSAEDYKNAWRRLVTIFDNTGVNNVDFIWILQATSFSDATRQPGFEKPFDMYPGNSYIDWVSADPYNTAFNGNWKSLQQIATPFVEWAKIHTPNKPLMFAEFGAAEDPTATDRAKRGKWFLEARAWIKTQARIKAVLYFNRIETFSSAETFRDWRVDTLSGTNEYPRLAFRQLALPYSQFGFGTLMQDCYFLQGSYYLQGNAECN